ncbi:MULTISPECIES: hypothetical protein [Pseudonocardia]|uniref:Uncharacterized protein n=2 Tax=Pseudonocardia TaxID=1847 RepID=A0A1Y2N8N6_PSEAH|nr:MULTISPECIES: hypothetical protein [Pseudonocardia]OSY43561.1 hypothetical protein BG845_00504 [Pseudonocardia autotrophica]TDN73448.1 hypothetical protein C8E95_2545 [Pseudonocardia autotrophica]BBG04188.1 hypothetical protein Pdca_53970 [Pseudonocardia autotrophica]GEC25519.1 hypothetical protein PSA01_25480 [Pseudonocardia saturnea]
MNLSNATKIKLIGDVAPRDVDPGSLAEHNVEPHHGRLGDYSWTETAGETTTRHFAPRSAVVEIF